MRDDYGPNAPHVQAFIGILPTLTPDQWMVVRSSRPIPDDASYSAAHASAEWRRGYAWEDARWHAHVVQAPSGAVRPVLCAVLALIVRDKIATGLFEVLVAPMRAAGVEFEDAQQASVEGEQYASIRRRIHRLLLNVTSVAAAVLAVIGIYYLDGHPWTLFDAWRASSLMVIGGFLAWTVPRAVNEWRAPRTLQASQTETRGS